MRTIIFQGEHEPSISLPFSLDRHRVWQKFELQRQSFHRGRQPPVRRKLADECRHLQVSFPDLKQLCLNRSQRVIGPSVDQISDPKLRWFELMGH